MNTTCNTSCVPKNETESGLLSRHPCFSRAAHHKFGRVHMPIAPACNIQCKYCVRKFDCANESRPGVSSRILSPSESMERVEALTGRDQRISVLGIAGPGDPLANEATFDFLRMANREYPELILCLSTNGLMLPYRVGELVDCGVKTLTVTINAVNPSTAVGIYSWVLHGGKIIEGEDAARLLVENQWKGLEMAIAAGLHVKVNTIFIPGVNEAEIPLIAKRAGVLGATTMNIMSLIPQADFVNVRKPSAHDVADKRAECAPFINMMSHCRQCRADAAGLLGEDKDMEMEALLAKIGDEYLEYVV
jgi:nitrogen fixation protein NifB